MSRLASEIIVGIDFGTTHSGVSWAVNGGIKEVRLIDNWPGSRSSVSTSEKVPSTISYQDGRPFQWGFLVTENEQVLRWVKLLLEPDSEYANVTEPVRHSNELLAVLQKDAISVVADYLSFLWEHTMRDIERRQGRNFREIYAIKVVMSVPAMWTPGAKERTLQAARRAQLSDDIQLVTEPEAAALATLKARQEAQELQPGDCFVVCDAGGGTVDLISYEVLKAHPLQVRECAIGSGELCGSAFLDMNFERWVRTIVGEPQYAAIPLRHRATMMREFEYVIKRQYRADSGEAYSVELRGVEDDEANGIRGETIIIPELALRTMFDGVCLRIEVLVSRQLEQIRTRQNRRAKAILLVGGFGESSYLYDMLDSAHRHQGIPVLQVRGSGWSAICRGATLWGLEHSQHVVIPRMTVTSRVARYSYGIAIIEDYDPSRHHPDDRYTEDGKEYARNQMKWLIRRGEEFDDDQVESTWVYHSLTGVKMFSKDMRDFHEQLLYSNEDLPPKRRADPSCKALCEVSWQVDEKRIWNSTSSRKVDGVKYRDCYFQVTILLGNADLIFGVMYDKKPIARCQAKYPES